MALSMIADLCASAQGHRGRPRAEDRPEKGGEPRQQGGRDIVIPIDRQGMIHINWADDFEKAFNHLSYYACWNTRGA